MRRGSHQGWQRLGRVGLTVGVALIVSIGGFAAAQTMPGVHEDPLVRMPGTQPGQVSIESPGRCLNCHAGYNSAVEPGFNWQGSMMAQAARDPLYLAALTVAAQDSEWALGRPNAADLCLRCHFPEGWLEGRSDPPSGAAMTGFDFDGVQCDLCHRLYDPLFETTYQGLRESGDWLGYWDETNVSPTPSQDAADLMRAADAAAAVGVEFFNGNPFFDGSSPVSSGYSEATGGQYFVDPDAAKRGSFADADARHQMAYSRYHKSAYLCGTCHDVSNPALANLAYDGTLPGDGTMLLPSESTPAGMYFHIERTFSEFLLSAYAGPEGAAGEGPFAPEVFDTSTPGDAITRCQDCHMRDVSGAGADKQGVPVRPAESIEHPQSGQPLHDLTGGNVWVSAILASTVPGSPNFDAINAELLGAGPDVLVIDLEGGLGIDPIALLAGRDRAGQQLLLAAAIAGADYDSLSGALSFQIRNQTGHKLISGFPEGRRMFVNIRAFDESGALIAEINPYDHVEGTLRGLPTSVSGPALLPGETHVDELVYEVHASSSLTGEQETFHVVLADERYKDNRIPPKGFDIEAAADRLVVPVWHGVEAPDYFTPEEYAGGYDEVEILIVPGAVSVEINLYYQTTSREYVEFLRNEINGPPYPVTLPEEAYVADRDPSFSPLKAWGDTIWALWQHNKDLPGAAPVLMAASTVAGTPPDPAPPAPTLISVTPGHNRATLVWTAEHGGGSAVDGYRVYYDQSGKLQPRADLGTVIEFVDEGLTDGQEYCYRVGALAGDDESPPSNRVCATPEPNVPPNTPPAVALGEDVIIDEGAEFARSVGFTDEDSDSWTTLVDYGDGTLETPAAVGGAVTLAHAYADDGDFTVEVCITDDAGAVGCDVMRLTVENVAPVVGWEPDATTGVGQRLDRMIRFTDPGADSWSVVVDWGDDSVPESAVPAGSTVPIGHSWASAGSYVVEITVADDDGGIDFTAFGVIVGPACSGRPATLVVSADAPTVVGTDGNDVMLGSDGNDTLDGGAGNDTICGGDGNDVITGGDGNDVITGGAGVDWVSGGDGDDVIRLGARNDTGFGNAGDDVINGGGGADHIDGGPGADVIWDSFGADVDLYGGIGDDRFVVGVGDANHFDGGDGVDRVDYRAMTSGVTIDLSLGTTVRVGQDTFTSIEEARGSRHADVITGDTGANVLIGGGGDDTIYGMDGDDNLVGDKGDDTLYGGAGWDRLVGGDYQEAAGDYCLEGENIHSSCEHTALSTSAADPLLTRTAVSVAGRDPVGMWRTAPGLLHMLSGGHRGCGDGCGVRIRSHGTLPQGREMPGTGREQMEGKAPVSTMFRPLRPDAAWATGLPLHGSGPGIDPCGAH